MAETVHVFVIDSQPVFCAGIRTILETTTDLQLLGTTTSLKQNCSWAVNQPPDVLLLAANTSHDLSLETISAWKQEHKDCKILMMLSYAYEVSLRQMTDQGINGCILKTDTPQRFIRAIRSLFEGEGWFSPKLLQVALPAQLQPTTQLQLAEQDRVILRLICAEKSNNEIAATLHISKRTVCRYLEDVYLKLGVSSRLGAAIKATKMGLA